MKNIGTKVFTPLGQEPFPGFYARIDQAAKALQAAFVNAQWNIRERTIPNRPLLFGISHEHGCLVIPTEELNDAAKEEYLGIIEQTLSYYEDIVPFVCTSYKR